MRRGLARWGLLFAVAVLLGVAMGGFLSHSLLNEYGSIPIRWVMPFTPVVRAVLYWWTDGI
ncbi:MAG: hypothetical protein ACI9PP_000869 [Halobacteriales archaeon]|jgi:hypothetical protein